MRIRTLHFVFCVVEYSAILFIEHNSCLTYLYLPWNKHYDLCLQSGSKVSPTSQM